MKKLFAHFLALALFVSLRAQPGSGPAGGPSGGPATITRITDDTTTNATVYPVWVTAAAGNLPLKVSSSKVTFNPSTGTLSATNFAGTFAGHTWTTGTATLTLAGNLVTTGAFNTTFAQAASTTITLPATSSTMARTDAAQTFTGVQTFADNIIGSGATNAFNVAAGVTPATELEVDSTSTSSPRGIMSAQFNTGTDGARFHGRKARGTRASPLVVVSGDNLTRWVGSGYDGSNYLEDASIIFGSEGTIASTRVPTNIQFWTATDAAPSVLTQALILKSDQSATLAKNLTFGTAGSILSGTTGSQGITVTGTNQDFALTPSGTGAIVLSAAGGSNVGLLRVTTSSDTRIAAFSGPNDSDDRITVANNQGTSEFYIGATGNTRIRNTNTAKAITFELSTERARFAPTTGNLLLGGLTTDGTGVLQFPAATTSAGGIAFGTDITYYRAGTNIHRWNFGSDNAMSLDLGGTGTGQRFLSAGDFQIQAPSTKAIYAYSGGALALTLDSSQNATFAGTVNITGNVLSLGATALASRNGGTGAVTFATNAAGFIFNPATNVLLNGTKTFQFGATANATIGVSADTTAGNLVVTTPATGSMLVSALSGTGSRAVLADANGLLSAPVSDETWKEPLRDLPDSYGLDAVMKLRPAIYKYRDKSRFGTQDYIGFGARATSKILPEVTGQDRDGVYYMNKEDLTAVLVKAIQQQQIEIEQLRALVGGKN